MPLVARPRDKRKKNIHAIDGHLREESSQKEQISILIANRRIYNFTSMIFVA